MTNISPVGCTLSDVVDDPLIRLVMASDGVSERDLVGLMVRVRRAIRTQEGDTRRAAVAPAPRSAGFRFSGWAQGGW